MPTSSSARLSAQASSSARGRSNASAASGQRGSSKVPSGKSSNTTKKPPSRSTRDNQDDPSTRPPLSTAEILEKATLPLNGLSARDALTVWKALGLYLGEQLTQRHRVVSVDRFGVFGYNDASEAVFLHNQVFLQTNRLKENVPRQGLKGQPALAATAEAMSKVNAHEISQEYLQNCGRDVVENVVTHVVAFIGKAAKQARALRLSVHPLGEWVCSGETAEFKFLPDFQKQMIQSRATTGVAKSDQQPAKAKKETRTPDEMRERGRGAHEQVELRESEPVLTTEALEDHTTKAGTKSQPVSQAQSLRNRSKKSSASHRVGWSEPDTNASAPSGQRGSKRQDSSRKTAKPSGTRAKEGEPVGIVGRVRVKLLERCGERGLNALHRVLSLLDTSGDGVLSAQELKFGLRDLGIELSASELQQVVSYFDRNGDGVVSLDELLSKLRGKLSAQRRVLIEKAFDCMDSTRRGVVSLEDLRDNYDVSLLPRVRAGKKTKVQAMNEFLREWETSVEHNNGIPREAFVEYYHNVSACIADDSDFELLMKQTWHVSPPDSEPESDSDQDSGILADDTARKTAPVPVRPREENTGRPTQSPSCDDEWKFLRSVLLPPRVGVHTQPTLDDVCRRLGVNRVWGDGNETMNTRAFANALIKLDRSLHSKDAQHLAQLAVQCCGDTSGVGGVGDMISLAAVFQILVGSNPTMTSTGIANHGPGGAQGIVDRIRARLLQRLQAQTHDAGETVVPTFLGLNALQRTLRLLDSNGDRRLPKDELKIGLRKIGVDVNFHELDQLFTCLDADRSGCIDMDEFLVAMRGGDDALTKNARRLGLVHKAFDLLDRDRDGSVTLDELSRAYDTSKHPDVLDGRMTAQEALRQFAQQWDTVDKDGVITRREFEVYYRNVSAVVDSDDYFELMMRNAWHISGGVGQYANTSNRRVLVTKADGSQSVQEVKNDLGIRASDREKIHENLRSQGIHASEFATTAFVEDKKKPTKPTMETTSGRPWRRSEATNERPTNSTESQKTRALPRGKSSAPTAAAPTTEIPRSGRMAVTPSDFFASTTASDDRSAATVQERRQQQRQLRERAALLIQSQFRGFKCRKFADCVRRQMAAEAQRRQQREEDEQAPRRRVVTRAALKSFYGF